MTHRSAAGTQPETSPPRLRPDDQDPDAFENATCRSSRCSFVLRVPNARLDPSVARTVSTASGRPRSLDSTGCQPSGASSSVGSRDGEPPTSSVRSCSRVVVPIPPWRPSCSATRSVSACSPSAQIGAASGSVSCVRGPRIRCGGPRAS
ncbi:hypothetical protein [Pseudonocardia sp. HH130630-07]|uniref:hypothetical protein n=1 Tax=Pseudonocardia sp. HH130630-07 TaxID=1690815 RepID=UPI000814CA83|nr:hypothetical protein [Pseudonocardia sp. HH130630-07]ANY05832.1 hypothetical protein AFB00_05425 [Pseudonocardia sp. HH130630-07]